MDGTRGHASDALLGRPWRIYCDVIAQEIIDGVFLRIVKWSLGGI